MATANIELSDGTKVLLDGSPEEIARVLNLYAGPVTSLAAGQIPPPRAT